MGIFLISGMLPYRCLLAEMPSDQEGIAVAACQDGMLDIRSDIPSFGYLRCPDVIYSLKFDKSLAIGKDAFCSIDVKNNRTGINKMFCKTREDKVLEVSWKSAEYLNGIMTTQAEIIFPGNRPENRMSARLTITFLSPNWGHW